MQNELQHKLKKALALGYEKGASNTKNSKDNNVEKIVEDELLPTLINEIYGVETLSKSGKKPEAMSIYREIMNCSLKEAKTYVDQF